MDGLTLGPSPAERTHVAACPSMSSVSVALLSQLFVVVFVGPLPNATPAPASLIRAESRRIQNS